MVLRVLLSKMKKQLVFFVAVLWVSASSAADGTNGVDLSRFYSPPPQFKDFGKYEPDWLESMARVRPDFGRMWSVRRENLRLSWHQLMGPWPELLTNPKIEFLSQSNRENFVQHRVQVETAPGQKIAGYLLVPDGKGPMPAVI